MVRQRVLSVQCFSALAAEVLASPVMQLEKQLPHHGAVSCFDHSVAVALLALAIAHKIRLRVDAASLVRGALLHDLYLYDWHVPDPLHPHRLHGFFHPRRALENAQRHFALNDTERDIILRHMFPLTLIPPRCRESWLVCLADTLCAIREYAFKKR